MVSSTRKKRGNCHSASVLKKGRERCDAIRCQPGSPTHHAGPGELSLIPTFMIKYSRGSPIEVMTRWIKVTCLMQLERSLESVIVQTAKSQEQN